VDDPTTHRYPSYYGMPEFRRAIADFYERRFGVHLDPDTEVQPLVGSKEGLVHVMIAFVDPGDDALIPDPGYPAYGIGTLLAGGRSVPMPLDTGNAFIPDLGALRPTDRTKVMWLNYPTNPTAAVSDLAFFQEAVGFASRHDLLLCHDAAYSEITFDGYVAPSILEVPGAKETAVEFGSLSKTYNMTGWRIGYAVGNAEAIKALATVKTNLDSGIFNAVQRAGLAALTGPQDHLEQMREVYRRRRDSVVTALQDVGVPVKPPLGSIYIWAPTPEGRTSVDFAAELLEEAAVVVSPGAGYGQHGEGYFRMSLTVPDDRLHQALDRIRGRMR
jgi:LL-diaminopimelate aminotransferase